MKEFLRECLRQNGVDGEKWLVFDYRENINHDALSDDWLEKGTSYIYKVGVLTAIDRNKCDWLHIAIGTQRSDTSDPQLKGTFYFHEGENDDIGRVILRALKLLEGIHPVFDFEEKILS